MRGFTSWTPDPAGIILKTRMNRFVHPSGIEGLARVRGEAIDVLAVYAEDAGKGSFRAFVDALKLDFERIEIMEIMNRQVDSALERYGFGIGGRLTEHGRFSKSRVWHRAPVVEN